jgi:hypothetical protein
MPNSRPIHNTNVYVLCRRPAFYVQGVWGSMSQYMFKATSALRTPCRLLYTAVMRSLGSEIRRRGAWRFGRTRHRSTFERPRASSRAQAAAASENAESNTRRRPRGSRIFSPRLLVLFNFKFLESRHSKYRDYLCERAKGWFRAVVL